MDFSPRTPSTSIEDSYNERDYYTPRPPYYSNDQNLFDTDEKENYPPVTPPSKKPNSTTFDQRLQNFQVGQTPNFNHLIR